MSDRCFSRLKCIYQESINDIPLDGVDIDISIVDVHAKAVMSQRFKNWFDSPVEASYTFAMLATSAVCGFEMIRGDGTRVIGNVKEKKAAKQAYQAAVAQGNTASLGEEQTKDLLSIKVGNIQPSETVTIKITFLIPLTDDEKKEQVRFTFPRAYTERYGTPPTADAANMTSQTGMAQQFSINVSIQMANAIKSISCPSSHPIELSMGKPQGIIVNSSIPDSNFASVKLVRPTVDLDRDFILVVTATGLDAPRCLIESADNTTAVGLTFVPQFKAPVLETGMEYIFLVDRSGSMMGTPIKLLRQALVVLLRGLPTKNTKFNIFSFGSSSTSLWPASKDYTQQTLDEATAHVDKMEGDYGGTEIANALCAVFDALPKARNQPVSVFLLTDGDAWDVENCQNITRDALATPGAFIRVFTVGIGNAVSTDTVESIARAGEGLSIYVQDNEPMTGKLSRLVRASRTSSIRDIKLLWPALEHDPANDFEFVEAEAESPQPQQTINLFDTTAEDAPEDVGPPAKPKLDPAGIFVPAIQEAPLVVPGLFPGTRTQMYAIISTVALPRQRLPNTLKIRGTFVGTTTNVELEVDLTPSTSTSLIHTLAARALITDREEGKHVFPSPISSNPSLLDAYLEADIIRLGTTYGLTSKHTSYIAIDERLNNPLGAGDSVERDKVAYGFGCEDEESDDDMGFALIDDYSVSAYAAPLQAAAVAALPDEDDDDMGFGLFDSTPPPARSKSAVVSTADDPPMTAVARLQQFDGSFLLSDKLLQAIGSNKTVEEVRQALGGSGTLDEVIATCLALVWLERQADEGVEDMIEKAVEWLNERSSREELGVLKGRVDQHVFTK